MWLSRCELCDKLVERVYLNTTTPTVCRECRSKDHDDHDQAFENARDWTRPERCPVCQDTPEWCPESRKS
jgi:ribosome-binding protein aMBF1 (putative translation factor)